MLKPELRSVINLMITDAQWPGDEHGSRLKAAAEGNPTYDDITAYINAWGVKISRSAVGRYAQRIGLMSRMRFSAGLAKEVMADTSASTASETQKAVAEMITATAIELIAGSELSPNELRKVSGAIKDCAAIAIKADQYIRERIEAKMQAAATKVDDLVKKEISAETRRRIREEIYGIIDVDNTATKSKQA